MSTDKDTPSDAPADPGHDERAELAAEADRLLDVIEEDTNWPISVSNLRDTIGRLVALAAAPAAPTPAQQADNGEQAAFEDWLEEESPSGDHESVQRQWLESRAYADWLNQQGEPAQQAEQPQANARLTNCDIYPRDGDNVLSGGPMHLDRYRITPMEQEDPTEAAPTPAPQVDALTPLPKPAWLAVDTEGADFDVSFVTTEGEARDLIQPEDGAFDDLVTRLFTAEQMREYARAALAASAPTPQEPAETLGRCCYGGLKPKRACASCAAWQPKEQAEPDEPLSFSERLRIARAEAAASPAEADEDTVDVVSEDEDGTERVVGTVDDAFQNPGHLFAANAAHTVHRSEEAAALKLALAKEPIRVEPGSELHFSLLMAPYHLNLVVGKDRQHLLAYAADVWQAALATAQREQAEQAQQPADLMAVVEQILNEGHLNTEGLGRLRRAWEASTPAQATPQEPADFEMWWSIHLPDATQAEAWKAFQAAQATPQEQAEPAKPLTPAHLIEAHLRASKHSSAGTSNWAVAMLNALRSIAQPAQTQKGEKQ